MTLNPDDLSPGPPLPPNRRADADEYMWVITEPLPDGEGYMVTIQLNQDNVLSLTPDQATMWAKGFLTAAARAEYDTAVIRQLSAKLKISVQDAVRQVMTMRDDRPPVEGVDPLTLEPGVAMDGTSEDPTFRAFIAMYLPGRKKYGQVDPKGAREHALIVLESIAVAELDAAYKRSLIGQVGVAEGTARQVIHDLANFR